MKRSKILLLGVLVFVLFFGVRVKAETCSKEKYKELKQLADEIKVEYELVPADEEDKKYVGESFYSYTMYISNVSEELNVQVKGYTFTKADQVNGTITLKKYFPQGGYTVKLNVYGNAKSGCSETLIKTIKVSLPYYNYYSTKEECKDNADKYPICRTNANTNNMSEEKFLETLEKQKVEYENRATTPKEEKKEKGILDIIKENIALILTVLVAIVLVIVLIVVKVNNNNKNKIKIDLGDSNAKKKKKK